MRDAEGRLLGTVTTLEDVTTLQDTDRFKTQFISVASRKLRDPLLQLPRALRARPGLCGELRPCRRTGARPATSRRSWTIDGHLIEVAELDAGRASSRWSGCALAGADEVRDRFCEEAAEKRIRVDVKAYADMPLCWPTGARCAPFWTT